jgi:hypothetical protein
MREMRGERAISKIAGQPRPRLLLLPLPRKLLLPSQIHSTIAHAISARSQEEKVETNNSTEREEKEEFLGGTPPTHSPARTPWIMA